MDKPLAIQLLNLPDDPSAEEVQESFDNQMFTYKSFFLANKPIPSLWNNKVKRLQTLNEAKTFLLKTSEGVGEEVNLNPVVEDFLDYERQFYGLKLSISTSSSFRELRLAIKHVFKLEHAYYGWFIQLVDGMALPKVKESLKLGGIVDREVMLKASSADDLLESELMHLAQEKERIEKILSIKNIDQPSKEIQE